MAEGTRAQGHYGSNNSIAEEYSNTEELRNFVLYDTYPATWPIISAMVTLPPERRHAKIDIPWLGTLVTLLRTAVLTPYM